MIYDGITILDRNLKPLDSIGIGGDWKEKILNKITNWADSHNIKIVSVVRLVHPGEASAFGVDDIIKIETPATGTMSWGIWKVYGNVPYNNPRKKEMKMGKLDKISNIKKIMDAIDETPNEYRFRMQPPSKFHKESFRYSDLDAKGRISVIYGCPKGEWASQEQRCKKGTVIQSLRLHKESFRTKESAAKWIAKHTKPRRE